MSEPLHEWSTKENVCLWCGISKIEPNLPCPKHPRAGKLASEPQARTKAADDIDAIYDNIQRIRAEATCRVETEMPLVTEQCFM